MVPGPSQGSRVQVLATLWSCPDQELPTGTALSKNIKDEAVKPIIIDNVCKWLHEILCIFFYYKKSK